MKADDIRKANELCQKMAADTKDVSQHEAALESLKASMLTEVAAQLSEVNESLKYIAHPTLFVETGKIDPDSFKDEQPGKITFMPSQDVKTLRDEFAMAAMQGLFSASYEEFWIDIKPETKTAQQAYLWADSMLEARKK